MLSKQMLFKLVGRCLNSGMRPLSSQNNNSCNISSSTSTNTTSLLSKSLVSREAINDDHLGSMFAGKLSLGRLSGRQVAACSLFTIGGASLQSHRHFTTSAVSADLMEFFDTKANWNENTVKHGRPWSLAELRLRSNTDLHKLWFVLHKERNMLLTMEEAYKSHAQNLPSPERISKVDQSMENVLTVVEERNVAFNLLQTGQTKALITYRRYNSFGHIQEYRPREYLVPRHLNKTWRIKFSFKRLPLWSKFYRSLLRRKLAKNRSKILRRVRYATNRIQSKFGNIIRDKKHVEEYYKEKYGYKPPKPYHELIRRPRPDDMPNRIKDQLNTSPSIYKDL